MNHINNHQDFSFKKLSEKNGILYYYTNPSKSKYHTDKKEVIKFYENSLEQIKHKKWIWIFDSDGFGINHANELSTGKAIIKLVTTKYGDNLQEIKLINPTWHIKSMLLILVPFLSEKTKSKLKMLDDRYYSMLEFV